MQEGGFAICGGLPAGYPSFVALGVIMVSLQEYHSLSVAVPS